MEDFAGLWLLLNEQSGKFLFWVNRFENKKWGFTKPKIVSPKSESLNFMVEYFGEIETKFESYFASLIYKGPRWVGIMKKNEGRKSCDPLPFLH